MLRGRAVGRHQAALGHDDLALDLGVEDLLGRAAADPNELARDVRAAAAGGQHGQHVVDRGDLLPDGLRLPELTLDGPPGLAARIGDDLDPGQAVALELADDDLGLKEIAAVFIVEAFAVESVDLGDRVPGRLARSFADDLVDVRLWQERPIKPGSVLGRDSGGQDEDPGQDDDNTFGHGCLLSGSAVRAPTGRIWR